MPLHNALGQTYGLILHTHYLNFRLRYQPPARKLQNSTEAKKARLAGWTFLETYQFAARRLRKIYFIVS